MKRSWCERSIFFMSPRALTLTIGIIPLYVIFAHAMKNEKQHIPPPRPPSFPSFSSSSAFFVLALATWPVAAANTSEVLQRHRLISVDCLPSPRRLFPLVETSGSRHAALQPTRGCRFVARLEMFTLVTLMVSFALYWKKEVGCSHNIVFPLRN